MASAAMALLKGGGAKAAAKEDDLTSALDEGAGESFVETAEAEIPGTGLEVEEDGAAPTMPTTQTEVAKLTGPQAAAVAEALGLNADGSLADNKAAIIKQLFGKKTAGKGKALKLATKDGQVLGPDPLLSLSKEIEGLDNQEDIEARIRSVQESEGLSDFHLGGLFSRLKEVGEWGEYKNFADYVRASFGVEYRKAQYQISIYSGLLSLGIPYEKVAACGWTKLKELVKVLTSDNVDEWMAKALSLNTDSLIQEVKAATAGATENGETTSGATEASIIKTKTFKLHEDQLETVNAAIEKCKQQSSTDVDTVALFNICLEYLGNSTGKKSVAKTKVLTAKEYLESVAAKHGDDKNAALEELFGEESGFAELFPGIDISEST